MRYRTVFGGEILIAFALFEDAVTKEENRLMVAALQLMADMSLLNEFNHFSTQTQRHFITFDKKHKQFLTILGIFHEFLQDDPGK